MKKVFLALILSASLTGCKTVTATTPPLAPGAVNSFDQQSYAALMAVQSSLNSLNASYKSDPNLASIQPVLAQATIDYNTAELAWQTLHAALVAGNATTAQQNALSTSLAKVQGDIANIKVAQ